MILEITGDNFVDLLFNTFSIAIGGNWIMFAFVFFISLL